MITGELYDKLAAGLKDVKWDAWFGPIKGVFSLEVALPKHGPGTVVILDTGQKAAVMLSREEFMRAARGSQEARENALRTWVPPQYSNDKCMAKVIGALVDRINLLEGAVHDNRPA